jgi:hypothetical protein
LSSADTRTSSATLGSVVWLLIIGAKDQPLRAAA